MSPLLFDDKDFCCPADQVHWSVIATFSQRPHTAKHPNVSPSVCACCGNTRFCVVSCKLSREGHNESNPPPFSPSVIWWHPTKLLPLIFIFKCFVFVKPTTRTDESAFKNTSETSVNLSPREAAGLAGGFVQAAHICLFATGGGSLHILSHFWKSTNGTLKNILVQAKVLC